MYLGAGSVHAARRRASSCVVDQHLERAAVGVDADRVAVGTSAIGPPTNASGAMCPTLMPFVAPLNRPSVISATSLPSPAPATAAVTASISGMPGEPFGPS